MKLACSEDELMRLLNEVAFTRNFGFVLHEIADGECSIDVPFQEAFERPGGIVSGQVFMASADVAMWLAIKTRLGLADSSVTAEMKTNFLGGAEKSGFRCTAKVLKFGRTRTNVGLDIYNLLNSNPVLTYNSAFIPNGGAWLVPTMVLQSRFVKISAAIDF